MHNIYEPEYVRRLFNRMSASYERMNYITSFGFSIRWRRQFIAGLASNQKDIRVIDLLSGLGENWSTLLRQFPNASFIALDFSENMYRVSREKSRRKFDNRIEVLHQDILQHQLPAEGFDIVTCAYGLKTFNEAQLERLAATIHEILKPGGQFSFVEVSKPGNRLLLFFYRLYLRRAIPVLGKLFLGNPSDYRMLWEYTERFGNAEQVKRIFERQGLEVKYTSYFFGCATGISGRKPKRLYSFINV